MEAFKHLETVNNKRNLQEDMRQHVVTFARFTHLFIIQFNHGQTLWGKIRQIQQTDAVLFHVTVGVLWLGVLPQSQV